MRTNVKRIETEPEPRKTCQSCGAPTLELVRAPKLEPTSAERETVAGEVLVIYDEHLRDQLEAVFGFRPRSFGR